MSISSKISKHKGYFSICPVDGPINLDTKNCNLTRMECYRCCCWIDTGEVAIEWHRGIGKADGFWPSQYTRYVEAASEEHKLDICSDVDDIECYRSIAGVQKATIISLHFAFILLAAQVGGILAQVLSLCIISNVDRVSCFRLIISSLWEIKNFFLDDFFLYIFIQALGMIMNAFIS